MRATSKPWLVALVLAGAVGCQTDVGQDGGAGATHSVKYEVTGSASRVDITEQNDQGNSEQFSGQSLPYEKTFTFHTGAFTYLSAQNSGDSDGDERCNVYVDGKLVTSNRSSGQGTICEASGTVPSKPTAISNAAADAMATSSAAPNPSASQPLGTSGSAQPAAPASGRAGSCTTGVDVDAIKQAVADDPDLSSYMQVQTVTVACSDPTWAIAAISANGHAAGAEFHQQDGAWSYHSGYGSVPLLCDAPFAVRVELGGTCTGQPSASPGIPSGGRPASAAEAAAISHAVLTSALINAHAAQGWANRSVVSDVRISRADSTWASAVLGTKPGYPETQSAGVALHLDGGAWQVVNFGDAMLFTSAPPAVAAELGGQ